MTDSPKPDLAVVGSAEFERSRLEAAQKRANEMIDWALANPDIAQPFQSAEFRQAFPDVTVEDVQAALDEVERISAQ